MKNPMFSVVVNFFNMRREASRTLFSMSAEYQRNVPSGLFEVIAVDNGSQEPIGEDEVSLNGPGFRYFSVQNESVSPAAAMNQAARLAKGDYLLCVIDGARILSPGIYFWTQKAFRAFDNPFVMTLAMHIGSKVQNELVKTGYSQEDEDRLLHDLDWRQDGYSLFGVSSMALSSEKGFFSPIAESNCFAVRRSDFLSLGGFDERFQSLGGGLMNHDFMRRAMLDQDLSPVMLLGEATFHQFHCGVATNALLTSHPWEAFAQEYEEIKGEPFEILERKYHYLGHVPQGSASMMSTSVGNLQQNDEGRTVGEGGISSGPCV